MRLRGKPEWDQIKASADSRVGPGEAARQGAGQARPVKMQRPAGRTILTGLAWSAGLVPWSMADGMIRLSSSQQRTVDGALAIIPEPECPHRRERFTNHGCRGWRTQHDLGKGERRSHAARSPPRPGYEMSITWRNSSGHGDSQRR